MLIARLSAELEHSLDRAARPLRNLRSDRNFVLHGLQRMQDLWQRVSLHVRAEIARPHEFDARITPRHVVGYRTLRHEQDARPSSFAFARGVYPERSRRTRVGESTHV